MAKPWVEVENMVNFDFVSLALMNLPEWVSDAALQGIAKRLRKERLEIDRVLEETENMVRFKLKPSDGRRLSMQWFLEVRKPEFELFGVQWRIYFK